MKKHRWFSGLTFTLVLVLWFGATGSQVNAIERYWDAGGGGDNDWSNTNNWTANTEPTTNDMAYMGHINYEKDASAEITQTGEACYDLYMPFSAGTTGTVSMTAGDLTVVRYLYVGYWSKGTFTQNAGTTNTSPVLEVGYNPGANGTYTLNGGKLNAAVVSVGFSGSGTFNLNDGEVDMANALCIGNNGIGTFTQAGGRFSNTNIVNHNIGQSSGSTGTYTMTGGELTLHNVYLGNNGQGTFTQNAGTNTLNGVYVGYSAIGKGTYTLNGGKLKMAGAIVGWSGSGTFELNAGEADLTGALTIGENGIGTFTQAAGKLNVTNGTLTIGSANGSTGAYTMTGGELTAHTLYVGSSGQGTFTQNAGTTNTVTSSFQVGRNSTGNGTYTMNGGKLNAPGLILGYLSGSGTFELNDGEADLTGNIILGYQSGSIGTVKMAGGELNMADYYVLYQSGAVATLRGWGLVKPTGSFYMNGLTIADGYGTNNTLVITNYSALVNNIANGASETNGWYARNHGKLVLKDVPSADPMYWGEQNGTDLVNSVKFDFTGFGGSGQLSGSLYASDHGDVPEYAPSSQITAIWKFETNNFTFSSADLTFHYDHAKAAELGIAESNLKVYHHPAGKWQQVTPYSVDTNANTITASNVVSFSYFAVGEEIHSPIRGTAFMIN